MRAATRPLDPLPLSEGALLPREPPGPAPSSNSAESFAVFAVYPSCDPDPPDSLGQDFLMRNRNHLRCGFIVSPKTPSPTLWNRLRKSPRPLTLEECSGGPPHPT